jgi:hypothetical protein
MGYCFVIDVRDPKMPPKNKRVTHESNMDIATIVQPNMLFFHNYKVETLGALRLKVCTCFWHV